jgi:hypothetical protein
MPCFGGTFNVQADDRPQLQLPRRRAGATSFFPDEAPSWVLWGQLRDELTCFPGKRLAIAAATI